MKCSDCKFDNDCKARSHDDWTYAQYEGKEVTGCNKGKSKDKVEKGE